jgi:hypothetical protein
MAAHLLDSERSSYDGRVEPKRGEGQPSVAAVKTLRLQRAQNSASPRPSRVGGEERCTALARLGEIELRREGRAQARGGTTECRSGDNSATSACPELGLSPTLSGRGRGALQRTCSTQRVKLRRA